MTELTGRQRKYLRGLAHTLAPVVHIGKRGFSAAVATQVREALEAHELIKVRVQGDRDERGATVEELAASTGSAVAGLVGGVAILYRPRAEAAERRIRLP